MLVVNAPKVTRRNTQMVPMPAKTARAGLCVVVRRAWEAAAMSWANAKQKRRCCLPQTL